MIMGVVTGVAAAAVKVMGEEGLADHSRTGQRAVMLISNMIMITETKGWCKYILSV